MFPAGEIWSVVIESPKYKRTFKFLNSLGATGFLEKLSKYGGFLI